jgi:hypothetical protein
MVDPTRDPAEVDRYDFLIGLPPLRVAVEATVAVNSLSATLGRL